ncbi:S41 family peptidase [Pricia sp.]|uniref:S41 family peptidase n=1 Tax=Pricia sp. TaxID=2268138 RepID=UPI003592F8FF
MNKYPKFLLLFIAIGLFLTNCSNDDDIVPVVEPEQEEPKTAEDYPVQDFMWQTLNFWYFWQENVPNLSDSKFDSLEDSEYIDFLASENDPAEFFNNKLRFSEDRFTFFSDDYVELTQSLAGISKSNGMEFGLVRYGDGNDVFAYVRYIAANSDAATKDIKRGDIFIGVNGEKLFSDRNNLENNNFDLLFGPNSDSYTLNMADIVDDEITPNNQEVNLTKISNFAENPILLDTILNIGSSKVGYLMYNQFLNEYDEELNDVFGRFRDGGVTDLVLDMRYNPGGSVNSARLLSSMVHSTDTTNLFIKQRWNARIQSLLNENQLVDTFADFTDAGTPVNTLSLSKVYVLATNSSASASELVINGLAPYVDVIHIGETTTGKNEFSLTFVDDPDNPNGPWVYSSNRENQINPNNSWAIQPLVGRNENADGFFEYTEGLVPDIPLREDLEDLGVLGNPDEPLLARAILEITGSASAKNDFSVKMPIDAFTGSQMFTPLKDNMFLDKDLGIKPIH